MESDRSIFSFLLCEFRAIAEGSLANCQALIIWLTNLICHLLFDCISFSEFHELIKYNKALYCLNCPGYTASVHVTPIVLVCGLSEENF